MNMALIDAEQPGLCVRALARDRLQRPLLRLGVSGLERPERVQDVEILQPTIRRARVAENARVRHHLPEEQK